MFNIDMKYRFFCISTVLIYWFELRPDQKTFTDFFQIEFFILVPEDFLMTSQTCPFCVHCLIISEPGREELEMVAMLATQVNQEF